MLDIFKSIRIFLFIIFLLSRLALAEDRQFQYQYESEHARIFFENPDDQSAKELLKLLECTYQQLSVDFGHQIDKSIYIFVFPDIKSFHEKLNKSNLSDKVVACEHLSSPTFWMVSPSNPGTYHTQESLYKVAIVNLTKLFITDKYGTKGPYWLKIGTAYFEADMPKEYIYARVLATVKNHEPFPQLTQLEEFDAEFFFKSGGFVYSHSLVDFIHAKWGWRAVLALLEDIDSFSQVLGVSQDEFRHQWIEHLHRSSGLLQ